jgi:hypothetical protein
VVQVYEFDGVTVIIVILVVTVAVVLMMTWTVPHNLEPTY